MDSVVSGVRCVELFIERAGGYLKDGIVHYHYTVPLYTIRAWVEAHNWERAQDFIRACLQGFCAVVPCGVSTQGITCSSAEWHGEPAVVLPKRADFRCHCGAEFDGEGSVTRYIAHKRVHLPDGFFDDNHAGPPNPADFPDGRLPAKLTEGCVWVAYTGFPWEGREIPARPPMQYRADGVHVASNIWDPHIVAYRKDEVPANVRRIPVYTALDIIGMICRRIRDQERNALDHLWWFIVEHMWQGTGRACIPDGEGTLFGSWEAA